MPEKTQLEHQTNGSRTPNSITVCNAAHLLSILSMKIDISPLDGSKTKIQLNKLSTCKQIFDPAPMSHVSAHIYQCQTDS